jgi:hypothetical protein
MGSGLWGSGDEDAVEYCKGLELLPGVVVFASLVTAH